MKDHRLPIPDAYKITFDAFDRRQWREILDGFSDGNLFQTWSYDAIRYGEAKLSHFVMKHGEQIMAGAQSRILRLPLVGSGAAYVRWGPLWQIKEEVEDPEIFRLSIRALRNEYVCNRGLILRILPSLWESGTTDFREILTQEGFRAAPEKDPPRTMVLDLRPPLEILRSDLSQRWRRCLTKAERNGLTIVQGVEDRLFKEFISIYGELIQRKRFQKPNDINEFRLIQKDLPPDHQMQVILCQEGGITTAGGIFSAIGDTGIYLFGATNAQGMHNNSSYLVHWTAVQWMKNKGCITYNLYGVNPAKNPGTFVFKEGLAGKKGRVLNYLGRYDCYPTAWDKGLARVADRLLPKAQKLKNLFGKIA
jgi:hypothetical protein